MAEVRLLPAPIITPPDPEATRESTSLVPVNRYRGDRGLTPSDSSFPVDRYRWSVSAGDDGTYLFYAVPLSTSGKGAASNQPYDFSSTGSDSCQWSSFIARKVAAQYAFYASVPTPKGGHLLDLYA
jgi:hypothetical protein